jgi:hypothetical protein
MSPHMGYLAPGKPSFARIIDLTTPVFEPR